MPSCCNYICHCISWGLSIARSSIRWLIWNVCSLCWMKTKKFRINQMLKYLTHEMQLFALTMSISATNPIARYCLMSALMFQPGRILLSLVRVARENPHWHACCFAFTMCNLVAFGLIIKIFAMSPKKACARLWASFPRIQCCLTTAFTTTSPMGAPMQHRKKSMPPPNQRIFMSSSKACQKNMTPSSANAA